MDKRKLITASLSAIGILLFILDGKTAVSGASQGIEICLSSVIPSLFPFFVLSNLLTGSLSGQEIPFLYPLSRLFRVPKGAESLLLTGFLGGYPVGAQCIAEACRTGQLSKSDGERMIAFCNNAGPSFLFGIIAPILSTRTACLLWGIHIFSAFLVSLCIPSAEGSVMLKPQEQITVIRALRRSITVMATVCGWVILFRVCIAFCDRWFLRMLPKTGSVLFIGLLELANGCLSLRELSSHFHRLLICSSILGFGGLCVTMQTLSVTDGLDMHFYFPGKILQTAFSILFICLLFHGSPVGIIVSCSMILISLFCLRKMKKRSRNQLAVGV